MFDVISRHFVAVSALAVIGASTATMLFLAMYLSVFDWTLIWLIEYSDLTKFFLLGAAFLSVAFIFFAQFLPQLDLLLDKNASGRKFFLPVMGLLFLATPVIDIIHQLIKHNWSFAAISAFSFMRFGSYIFILLLLWTTFSNHQQWRAKNWKKILQDSITLTIALGIFGYTFGLFAREKSLMTREIVTKSKSYSNATLILGLSHHVAFLHEDRVVVVPATEIIETTAVPKAK